MSGPKCDQMELERRRKAELERARQERLRKIREETERLNNEMSKTKTEIDRIDQHLASLVREVEHADEMALVIPKLYELKAEYNAQLTKALRINVPAEPDAISACTGQLASITRSVIESYFYKAQHLEERIMDYSKQLKIQDTVESIFKDLSSHGIEKIEPVENFDFIARANNVAHTNIELTIKERAAQILSEIEGLVNSESILESDMKNLMAAANNIYRTAFETNSSFEAAVIEYNVEKTAVVKNMAIFDDIYQDYYAKYVDYLNLINKNMNVPVSVAPKEKYYFVTIEELQGETEKIDRESRIVSERNYIREQIDEVMAGLGYNLSEEIVFDTDKNDNLDMIRNNNHYICKNESGQSVIHIHISDTKQIMMEIVGIGENTNVPDKNCANGMIIPSQNLSAVEREKLLSEQGGFCEIHPKIVDELEKRGVMLNAKFRKPPDLKYCTKIIPSIIKENVAAAQSELINKNAGERRRFKGQRLKLREMKIR